MQDGAIAQPRRDWEYVEGWGMSSGSAARVLRPRCTEELIEAIQSARRDGVTLAPRGTGCSYGDASSQSDGRVLDLTRMNKILSFDAETGVLEAEAGLTIEGAWKHILSSGWWPYVVSGTMYPTIGGAAAMNIHGKNNFRVGTFGDHVREFDLVLPSGEVRTANREQNSDLFHAAIGGFGSLGVFSRIVMDTKRVHSGLMEVRGVSTHDLAEMMAVFEAEKAAADYLVGWIDAFPGGDRSGRGLVHVGRNLGPGEDAASSDSLDPATQSLPANILGVIPKSEMWRGLRLFNHDLGMRLVNAVKYQAGRVEGMGDAYLQSHAAFHFLLDFVPNWKWAYGRKDRRGLIQYQVFLPDETAHDTLLELLDRCRASHHVSYLGVLKRHRPDPFWLTHSLDGWSLALDFKVDDARRSSLLEHCHELTELVLAAGGKFYFAKDSVLRPEDATRFLPSDRMAAFSALKRELDPEGLFTTDLMRRVFPS